MSASTTAPKAYELLLDAVQLQPIVTLCFWTGGVLLLLSVDGEDDDPASWKSHVTACDVDEVLKSPGHVVGRHTEAALKAWSSAS